MKPLIIAAPLPRTLKLIFTPDKLTELHQQYEVVETTDESRAEVVDFDALQQAVASGSITAATDVFPQEPLRPDHPVRTLSGFLRLAHRAGVQDIAFKQMDDRVLDDMTLMDRGLLPMRCKRAERETVNRMRSKPVTSN